MQLTLRGLSQIEYLVTAQVLFSYNLSNTGLHDWKGCGAKYEMVSLAILCINTKLLDTKAILHFSIAIIKSVNFV